MLSTILIIVLVLLLIGALPTWPYSSGWGYYPGGGLGLILVIVIVLGARRTNIVDAVIASGPCQRFARLREPVGSFSEVPPQRMSFAHSSSVSTLTPSLVASASFEPAPGPATT